MESVTQLLAISYNEERPYPLQCYKGCDFDWPEEGSKDDDLLVRYRNFEGPFFYPMCPACQSRFGKQYILTFERFLRLGFNDLQKRRYGFVYENKKTLEKNKKRYQIDFYKEHLFWLW